MTQQTNLPSFEKLKEKLATDPIMERYRQLTQKVHQNEKLLALYDEYIKKQKELIKFEHYGKLNAKLQKEAEMKALEDELYDNPLFNEYIQTQIELNELFSTMTHIIQYKVNKHLSELLRCFLILHTFVRPMGDRRSGKFVRRHEVFLE